MKYSGFENIDPGVRAFILIVIAVAYPAWDFGFEIGAFGRLFYEKVFVAWAISTALFVVLLVVPRDKLQVPTLAWFATAIPSLWLVLALAIRATPDVKLLGYALTASGFIAYLACFPYVIYMAITIVYPDLLRIRRRRAQFSLVAIILALAIAGYVIGINHTHLLTCEDFAISGNYIPADCRPSPN